jgi:serine protease Do
VPETLGLKRAQGVVITAIERGSAADDAGLRRGDVILEINRENIRNLTEYRHAIAGLKKGEASLFLVQRGQSTSFVVLRAPKEKASS